MWSTLLCLLGSAQHSLAQAAGPLEFPRTEQGYEVLAGDLHIHTLFSDGNVWPTVRVDEARAEGLAAIAISDHVEIALQQQWLNRDPRTDFVDKNAGFVIASKYAGGSPLVIHGAEITRGIGHIGCVFISDSNALRTSSRADARSSAELATHFHTLGEKTEREVEASLKRARAQGGTCIWNHPYWPGQEDMWPHVQPVHRRLIESGLVQGLEVANGLQFHPAAIDIALEHGLAMLGSSDAHRYIASDLERTGLPHRTMTLFLAKERTAEAIRDALLQRRTIAVYRHMFIGRAEIIEELLRNTLVLKRATHGSLTRASPRSVMVALENAGPIELRVEALGRTTFSDQTKLLTLPAGARLVFRVSNVDPAAFSGFSVRVLNSYVNSTDPLELHLPLQDE